MNNKATPAQKPAKVRVLVAAANRGQAIKSVSVTPVKALQYEGCHCWASS